MFFKGYVETKDKKCIEKFKNRTDAAKKRSELKQKLHSISETTRMRQQKPRILILNYDDSSDSEATRTQESEIAVSFQILAESKILIRFYFIVYFAKRLLKKDATLTTIVLPPIKVPTLEPSELKKNTRRTRKSRFL